MTRVVLATVERHKQGGALGEKFEMAYLRPLEIGNPSREEAEAAWRDGGRTAAAYRKLAGLHLSRHRHRMRALGNGGPLSHGRGRGRLLRFPGSQSDAAPRAVQRSVSAQDEFRHGARRLAVHARGRRAAGKAQRLPRLFDAAIPPGAVGPGADHPRVAGAVRPRKSCSAPTRIPTRRRRA